jgi:hypothetical protein
MSKTIGIVSFGTRFSSLHITVARIREPRVDSRTTSTLIPWPIISLDFNFGVVVVKKHIADNDLSATYRSLVIGIVGVIDEKSIE